MNTALCPSDTALPAECAPRVSMFADAFAQKPMDCALSAILEAIRSGRYAQHIARLRDLRVVDEEAYQKEKRKLPAFCVSGTAANRTEPGKHSGLLQIDLDKLNGTLGTIREQLKADPHVAFGFVSPSGDGLKLGLRIDSSRHRESFEAASDYFRSRYGLKIDASVKDRLRLCFVSHDPDLWMRRNAEVLPVPDAPQVPAAATSESENQTAAAITVLTLPSLDISISESARAIFGCIGPSHTLFWRGGAIVELVQVDDTPSLAVLHAEAFRSRAERHGKICAYRVGDDKKPVLKPVVMPRDTAAALLASAEARELLPPIASVLRCPVIIEGEAGAVAILGMGYHPEQGGLLITGGELPPQVPLEEAAASLHRLVEEFDFQTEGDRSRALAAFITPALRIGGFLSGNVPLDAAEADQSQSGKGFRHALVCSLYREAAYVVTARQGGVGSVDESFAAGLMSGRPFINLDNLRGRQDSQHLESFLTAPGLFPARVPRCGEALINPKRFLLQLSSNGFAATRDLVNRASICRIRKRPGFAYRDTLGELQSRQPYFLGCVFSLIAEWVASGKPRTKDCRHDFREWNQILDWICQNLLGCAPLMDGHQDAQERAANPSLTWLRAVALAVAGEGRLAVPVLASEICEVCDLHDLDIPGDPKGPEEAKLQVGRLMRKVFAAGDAVTVDGFAVARATRQYRKPSGDLGETYAYTFSQPSQ